MTKPPVFAVTMGDPAGIGPEITAKTLTEFANNKDHHGIAVGDPVALQAAVDLLDLPVTVRTVTDWNTPPEEGAIDIYDTGVLGNQMVQWGVIDERAGRAAVAAIETATAAAMAGDVDGVVTGPINKEAIWAAGSTHLGHTEMLGELTGVTGQDTMFVTRVEGTGHHLRIFFATRHQSLRDALDSITIDSQVESIKRAHRALQVFGVENPRLATAAINPHGGEGGAFGTEEIDVLAPAVEQIRADGYEVAGPIPADSVFHHAIVGRYDGVLSQYHDQGHIAAKTFDFDNTISVTVGLPILRTSVDHGTAFDIAGQGIADHDAMRSAYLAAADYAPFVEDIRAEYTPTSR